jgi:hypothetical protein
VQNSECSDKNTTTHSSFSPKKMSSRHLKGLVKFVIPTVGYGIVKCDGVDKGSLPPTEYEVCTIKVQNKKSPYHIELKVSNHIFFICFFFYITGIKV